MDWMPAAIREGIFTILFISGPLVLLAAGLGLTIGIIQAATQVQEQTLGSAVKIMGLFIALIVFGFSMFQYLRNYATQNLERAFKMVPTLQPHPLPRRNFMEVPLGDDEPEPGLIKAPDPIPKASKAGRGADALNDPDVEAVNTSVTPDRLAPPKKQVRPFTGAKNLEKQKMPEKKPVRKPAPAKPVVRKPVAQKPVATKPAPAPAKPAAQAPAPAKSTPSFRPSKKRKRRLGDSLNKLRGSLGGN